MGKRRTGTPPRARTSAWAARPREMCTKVIKTLRRSATTIWTDSVYISPGLAAGFDPAAHSLWGALQHAGYVTAVGAYPENGCVGLAPGNPLVDHWRPDYWHEAQKNHDRTFLQMAWEVKIDVQSLSSVRGCSLSGWQSTRHPRSIRHVSGEGNPGWDPWDLNPKHAGSGTFWKGPWGQRQFRPAPLCGDGVARARDRRRAGAVGMRREPHPPVVRGGARLVFQLKIHYSHKTNLETGFLTLKPKPWAEGADQFFAAYPGRPRLWVGTENVAHQQEQDVAWTLDAPTARLLEQSWIIL
eukprot:gene5409-biopygen1945